MKKLITHLYWGDPSEEFSQKLAQTLLDGGSDVLEVGIPYTDPVCDGEVFQRACARAIANGTTPPKVFEGIQKLRDHGYKQPIYLTSYYGPIFKMGVEKTVKKAKEIGVNGLIIPDILLEEQSELQHACKKNGLSIIQFATVYSSEERLKQICNASTDFIYCIALPGVTGDSTSLSSRPSDSEWRDLPQTKVERYEIPRLPSFARNDTNQLRNLIKTIKYTSDKPTYVGFGISSAEDAQKILSYGADGIIIGSAIAKTYERVIDQPTKLLSEMQQFIQSLKTATIHSL